RQRRHKEDGGPGVSAGRGTPRGRGSSKQRRRERGGGRSLLQPALPAGESRTGGRCLACLTDRRGLCPLYRIIDSERAGPGRSAHLGGGPDDVYRRVAPPGGRSTPRRLPRVAKRGPLGGIKATFPSP